MVLPDAPATIFEGEAELALVIGKKASHVKAADAMDYIFGYTCFIDGSARGLPAPGFFAISRATPLRRSGRGSSPRTKSRIHKSCRSGCQTTAP